MNEFDPATLVRDYGNWRAEALACRHDCALFDFSFMSRARVSGDKAVAALTAFQHRRVDDMQPHRIRYALRVNAANRVVADLTLWRHADGSFDVMSGRYTDIAELVAMNSRDLHCTDLSADSAIFAVQGPGSLMALSSHVDIQRLSTLDYFCFKTIQVAEVPCLIGRLGYTGERGFEIVAPRADSARLWTALSERIRPAGFAAVDSLRIEAGFMLFANDLVLGPTISELGVDPTGLDGNDEDQFAFVCCMAKTDQDPVLWEPGEACPEPPEGSDIVITSACFSTVAESVLVLGFSSVGTDPHKPPADPTGAFTEIRPVSRPFIDPLKTRPRGPLSPI